MPDQKTALTRPSPRIAAMALALLLEALLVVSWSGGFVGIRFAIDHAPIFLILLWRSLASGLILLPFALTIGPRIGWRAAAVQAVFGIFAMAGYLAGFALAIDGGVPTGIVALITDMLPLAVALLSWPILGQALTGRQWIGSALGLAGVLIASAASLHGASAPLWAYGLPLAGTLCLALVTLIVKRGVVAAEMPVHQSLCIQCLSAAAVFAIFAWREGGVAPIPAAGFIFGIAWLVFVATFAGWGLYYLALKTLSPARVTAVLYLSPPVTMIWAFALFGEPLSWSMAAGMAVSLAGIFMVARSG